MKFKFLKNLFKSKEEKHREKLLKDYEEGKFLKIEKPNINPQQNHKKKKNKNKNKNRGN